MSKLARRSLAVILPTIAQVIVFAAVYFMRKNNGLSDESLEFVLILNLAIASSFILLLYFEPFDRYWKNHIFAVFSALFPWFLVTVILTIRLGTGGYWYLGVLSLTILSIVAAFISIPVTLVISWLFRTLNNQR